MAQKFQRINENFFRLQEMPSAMSEPTSDDYWNVEEMYTAIKEQLPKMIIQAGKEKNKQKLDTLLRIMDNFWAQLDQAGFVKRT